MKTKELEFEKNANQKWNRKLLHAFWVFLLLSIVVEIVNLGFTQKPKVYFILHYMLLPSICIAVILLFCEALFRFVNQYMDYFIIAAAVLMATVLVSVHIEVTGIYLSYSLPILISVFYFKKSHLLYAYGLTVASYLLIFIVKYEQGNAEIIDCLTMLGELGIAFFLSTKIMERGLEIIEHLRQSIEESQELLVRTTVMEKLSKTDLLTGLYNHLTFHEYLEDLIEQCDRYHLEIQLAVFDIDNFKQVNDIYGHRSGDVVLKCVSNTIQTLITPDDFVSRYGGEEFAVIFTDKTEEQVLQALERIRETIASKAHEELDGNHVTISIGFHTYRNGMGKDQLFQGADRALYRAKRTGKNKTVRYLEEFDEIVNTY